MAHNKGRKVALLAGLALVVLSVAMVWTYWGEIQSWYEFHRDFERLGKNAQGYSEYRHAQTGIVFVRLPGGTFDMGSPDGESGRGEDEGPVHEVTLGSFLIAKYEVSQAQWDKVMGSNPARFKGETLPVDTVSWEDCQEFCKKTGLSLPTEAQWEYACRAGTSGAYAGTTAAVVLTQSERSSPTTSVSTTCMETSLNSVKTGTTKTSTRNRLA